MSMRSAIRGASEVAEERARADPNGWGDAEGHSNPFSAARTSQRYSRSPPRRASDDSASKRHKPAHPIRLKSDGSNYSIWQIKLAATFRFRGISAVLDRAKRHHPHSAEDSQLGIDILIDSVEDALLHTVVPPKGAHFHAPSDVLDRLHEMFGQVHPAVQSMHRASLMTLCQSPGERVGAYVERAKGLYDALILSGGKLSSSSFLQCLKEGVAPAYAMAVRLFDRNSKGSRTATVLAGELLAEESRLAREQTLHAAGGALIMHSPSLDVPPRPAGAAPGGLGKGRASSVIRNPDAYRAANATALCWNCGATGHKVSLCTLPLSQPPLKFKPVGWVSSKGPKGKHPPAPAAPPLPLPALPAQHPGVRA